MHQVGRKEVTISIKCARHVLVSFVKFFFFFDVKIICNFVWLKNELIFYCFVAYSNIGFKAHNNMEIGEYRVGE